MSCTLRAGLIMVYTEYVSSMCLSCVLTRGNGVLGIGLGLVLVLALGIRQNGTLGLSNSQNIDLRSK